MGLREIINDADALAMAMTVNHTKVINLYAKVSSSDSGAVKVNVVRNKKAGNASTENVDKIIEKVQLGNVEESEAGNVEGGNATDEEADDDKELEEGSELHDSEYSFNSQEEGDEEGVIADSGSVPMHLPVADAESDYASSDDLNSCSSTDEEQLEPNKPKYAEFNQDCDMKDPHFKIGMKFSSFKQFREAVRNYGIKNRCVMNFRPNNKKRCKAYCRKGCPFYLWAAPMVTDRNTIQIKSGILKHECTRDHNVRHVSAQWIAKEYMDQFRADPSWSIPGIIQAVKSNQEVNISRIKAWRAKAIARR